MKRKILGSVLLFFSFSSLFVGVCFLFGEKNAFKDPIKDVYVVYSPEDNNINVTLTNDDTTFTELNDSSTQEKKIVDDTDNFNFNYSQERINLQLKEKIESASGITIYYGEDTRNYFVGGMSTISLSSPKQIYDALLDLDSAINLYPKDFFKEYKDKGINLSIYLMKCYSIDNVTGVTDTSSKNVHISLAADYPIIESFHHEVYHYIDYCIESSGGSYTVWNNLNPNDFSYNDGLSYDKTLSYSYTFSSDSYFVNNYAQTNSSEDRASTFEYMMASRKAECLNISKPIWLKAKYISRQIDLFFDTVDPSIIEYWERYI